MVLSGDANSLYLSFVLVIIHVYLLCYDLPACLVYSGIMNLLYDLNPLIS